MSSICLVKRHNYTYTYICMTLSISWSWVFLFFIVFVFVCVHVCVCDCMCEWMTALDKSRQTLDRDRAMKQRMNQLLLCYDCIYWKKSKNIRFTNKNQIHSYTLILAHTLTVTSSLTQQLVIHSYSKQTKGRNRKKHNITNQNSTQ